MKPSWRGINGLKHLKKIARPQTEEKEDLVYMDAFMINGEIVFCFLEDGKVSIQLSGEEEDIGPAFFKIN